MKSLSVKYRPDNFSDVCSQESIIKILERQLEVSKFSNVYLFAGPSGCGKTTLARIFAHEINDHKGEPIEIDAASNSGVDNIRVIINAANERALDSEYKIYIIDECVTGDTEVLTDKGWKRFDRLDKTEKIAQYMEDGNIEFVFPYEYIERDYNGTMYKVSVGNKASFSFSPNHVQPLYYDKSGCTKESYIKDVKFAQSNRFIRSGKGVGKLNELSNMDRLAIALQADGTLNECKNHNYWTIKVKKENKKLRLETLLKNSGVEFKKINSTQECVDRYSVKTPSNITKKLGTYFNLESMNYSYANEFIEELMLWDGHKITNINTDNEYYHYGCIDKDNVDFCQCVAVLGGFSSRVSVEVDNRKDSYKDYHRLYLQKRFNSTPNAHVKKEEHDFNGKIYCVKVPSHKIFIRKDGYEMVTGNCHALSNSSWQALLKTIEEPPKYTMFMFCTTDPQKIPDTIKNRCMRFNLTRIPYLEIFNRLMHICQEEGFINYEETCDFIARTCKGQMRDAIATLEKCATYSNDLYIEISLKAINQISYDVLFDLINAIIDGDEVKVLNIVDAIYLAGYDLKLFIDQMLDFCLDLAKYCIGSNLEFTHLPVIYEDKIRMSTGFDNNTNYYTYIVDKLFELKNTLKNDLNPKITIDIYMLRMVRCQ